MLSYQHGFHAGNRADVLKHAVLDAVLRHLVRIPKPLFYVETHAARGTYDLGGPQALKTGEAQAGVLALAAAKAPKPLRDWLELVRPHLPTRYPGSPALAAHHLRDQDRMVFFEKHPAEHAALVDALGPDPRARIEKADGYPGALRLTPRRGEQMLVFVDPSYETLRDMDELAAWAPRALKRWPRAILLLWLPLFRDEREAEFGAFLASLDEGFVAGARWPIDIEKDTALAGSAIVGLRAPSSVGETAASIASSLQSLWSAE